MHTQYTLNIIPKWMKVKDRLRGEREEKEIGKQVGHKKQTDIKIYKNFSNMKCHCATKKECPL